MCIELVGSALGLYLADRSKRGRGVEWAECAVWAADGDGRASNASAPSRIMFSRTLARRSALEACRLAPWDRQARRTGPNAGCLFAGALGWESPVGQRHARQNQRKRILSIGTNY